MACELGSSPFADSGFDDSWLKAETGSNDLETIRAFNANFEPQSSGVVDLSQTFSSDAAAQPSSQSAYNFNTTANTDLDQTICPSPVYEAYPPTFTNNNPASPYFQSVENSNGVKHHTSSLRHEHHGHRRSVSEPPGMPHQPAMMFHRDEHYLGSPMAPLKVKALKSQPSHKANRSQPYPTLSRKAARQQMPSYPHAMQHPYQHQHQQGFRPSVHRSQTQPARQYAPTSTPMMSPQQYMNMSPPAPAQQQTCFPQSQHTASPRPQVPMLPDQNSFMQSTSRVCTPAAIDPALSTPSPPGSGKRPQSATLNIPMTVDELRAMIFETVKEAVSGTVSDGNSGSEPSGAVQSTEQLQQTEEQALGEEFERLIKHEGCSEDPRAVQMEETEDIEAFLGVAQVEKSD
ncbi:hypothetical protein CB0940_02537 [Cercospora beticola]|uniref:Uncharacterized protein n=1 Tax=Cercospora beticola TaxID=122368 RepID=A0A2G5I5W1_CERBT|nr:hypothetical protein CB0940_02537 [Cercospora beticola]PIA99862.1 hypothetical protein CB0940_02537 [Cercospora beticola]WPA99677.1 hypothetical protein RHO25_004295 [Cercospora beticola]CAK1362178.1 unnamed protein product [Cercospora beticola]